MGKESAIKKAVLKNYIVYLGGTFIFAYIYACCIAAASKHHFQFQN